MADYTNLVEIGKRISNEGIELRTDHDFEAGQQSIEWANQEVNFYLYNRYPSTVLDLSRNPWVNFAACVYAVYHLCWTRLNSIPGSVKKEKDNLDLKMQAIQQGKADLPFGPNPDAAPTMVNVRVALGCYPTQLVERTTSVGPGLPPGRRSDPFQPWIPPPGL